MAWDSERELEKIFLSYDKILRNFKILEIKDILKKGEYYE